MLESIDLAPGNLSTLRALTDFEKRPPVPHDPPPPDVGPDARQSVPVGRRQVGSEHQESASGSGTRASGMTNEYLFTLLESEDDLSLFSQFAGIVARGGHPPECFGCDQKGPDERVAQGQWRGAWDCCGRLFNAWLLARSPSRLVMQWNEPFHHFNSL